jgi:hypothetical protein
MGHGAWLQSLMHFINGGQAAGGHNVGAVGPGYEKRVGHGMIPHAPAGGWAQIAQSAPTGAYAEQPANPTGGYSALLSWLQGGRV